MLAQSVRLSDALILGLDFGSQSVRALVVAAADGAIKGLGACEYSAGTKGVLLDPADTDLARQKPSAYLEAMEHAVRDALEDVAADRIVAIGVGTTGSTPMPVDNALQPLSNQTPFADSLAAQAWMWKDHTAHAEALEITESIREAGLPYLEQSGGTYSSEWLWAKILHCARTSPEVFDEAHTWLELQDFIPVSLCGQTDPAKVRLGMCAAGHKGMFDPRWGGYPSAGFLDSLHSGLGDIRERLPIYAQTSDQIAGALCAQWARRTGLPEGIPVTVGCLDAHAGAIGAGVSPGRMVKMIGTSSCDIAVSVLSAQKIGSDGLCGAVDGSVIPGMAGLEAGQAAVGDLFAWGAALTAQELSALEVEAAKLAPGESGLLALDWNNGNRSTLMDARLSGVLIGQSLHTNAAEIHRALIEASAFGSRMILERFEAIGANPEEITICGGVAEKSPLLRQVYADVLQRPLRLETSPNAAALGAAMLASVASGYHADVSTAQSAMGSASQSVTQPDPANRAVYDRLFTHYTACVQAFGQPNAPASPSETMKDLLSLRDEVRRSLKE